MTRPAVVVSAVVVALAAGLGTADGTAGRPPPRPSAITAGSLTTVRQATWSAPTFGVAATASR